MINPSQIPSLLNGENLEARARVRDLIEALVLGECVPVNVSTLLILVGDRSFENSSFTIQLIV